MNLEATIINPHLWVEKYADYLYTYALTRINDEEQAKDLVQETFLAALENIEKFQGKSSEKTWLTAILKHKIFDIYRTRVSAVNKKNYSMNSVTSQNFFQLDDGHWKIEHRPVEFAIQEPGAIENREFYHILQACLKKLPALWIAVFTMKFMDDCNTESICRELKVTTANYWVIIHRTKINLRACLQKNWL